MLSPSFILAVCFPITLGELTARQLNTVVLAAITVVVCVSAAALTISALRRLRIQHARADELAGNLVQVREESRRRLLFLNAISHDLRTPLNGITLQTHVIESAIAAQDSAALTAAVGDIRNSSFLAAEILDALLQYAHTDIDQTVIAPVNLKQLVAQIADPFRAAAEEKSLAFTASIPDNLVLRSDAAKLQRILANLLDNAVKFTANGGITIKAHAPSDGVVPVVLTIHDTGCGIPQQDQPRLFNEFFQANNPSRDARLGLGLGLVIARRLTQQLHGTLTCTSEPGSGTTFSLALPPPIDANFSRPR